MNQWTLYGLMLKSRLFEQAVSSLWHQGLISGEMHLGTGEEAINAGVVSQLSSQDAIALDHRGTAALLMRGIDPAILLFEFLGHEKGLCRGQGGHMHLFSKKNLSASSGIVGAAGPAAVGFAIASQYKNKDSIAVAFFGEGAVNQGMLMESMNLASAWDLPVLFVCKNDEWSITTSSKQQTGGNLLDRAKGLGVKPVDVDGLNAVEVYDACSKLIPEIRAGKGPVFLHCKCIHLEGHFLGYQLLRMVRKPLKELPVVSWPLSKSFLSPGGNSIKQRILGLRQVLNSVLTTLKDPRQVEENDPLRLTRNSLGDDQEKLEELENSVKEEINSVINKVMEEVG